MKVLLSCIADAADLNGGDKLWIAGVRYSYAAVRFPVVVPRIPLALVFRADPFDGGKHFEIDIYLVDPDGKILRNACPPYPMDVPDNPDVVQQIVQKVYCTDHVQFDRPGSYRFDVFANKRNLADVTFEIIQVAPLPGMEFA